MTGKVPQNHQVTTLAPGPKSVSTKSDVASSVANNRSTNSPVTIKGHGGQPQGPLVATNNEGPRSPSSNKVGLSSPFSYASAVANRSKAPFSGSIECEQYRALAAKARESPRILSIKLQKPPAPTQEPEKALGQADWGELLFNSCGIDPKDIKGIDFQAGGSLNCEVKLRQRRPCQICRQIR